ncbi:MULTISPECIES: WXG100 family type VII secretion target [Corynebacterium]|uniref:WXG100 family type VII secretion target n=1 Tax=Corynebacterium TaxID=1716 RepID=UPI00254A2585|nr:MULTISPECIES: WXG100 family type VII secretion target [Corynebacterium]MDK6260882.1 WXG100 family type VII secretion target [Corynebacterium frankenforstense]MDK8895779.1 WXG100 family type VII secretion target [Corynebacterium sp. MSK006]
MSGQFSTDSEVMQATANRVDGTNSDVRGELDRLQGVVDGVRASWKGEAQRSFDHLMVRWDASARDLQEALRTIADTIRGNARSFDDTETANTEELRNAGAGLPI